MTATSGPGFSLMQEAIGYACMTEAPCVIVNVQRSGPSTGQPTEPAQGDMLQARWGTHGDHEIIALAPASVQECVDLTRLAFDLAEEYRNPVLVMTDGEVGHMREPIELPDPATLEWVHRRPPTPEPKDYLPFGGSGGSTPEMAVFGSGYHTYVTGLTHDERGLPSTDDAEAHTALVERLVAKIRDDVDRLTRVETDVQKGAKVGVVSYGISARSAAGAIRIARSQGIQVSHLRLIGVFPFPEKAVRGFVDGLDRVIVPEMNLGQICHVVREAIEGAATVERVARIGGEIIRPGEIVTALVDGGDPV
jgi:2-oxoglutarate ferredoxin oxidoreductase subunit alpha